MMRLSPRHSTRRRVSRPADRRGMAIIVTLILTVALGALALSAVYLASGTKVGIGLSNRAADLQYAADAALQVGKSYINADPDAMPATGYREITFNGGVLKDAGGNTIQGVKVKVWAGPTGATSGQFGAFGSIIAQATDQTGGKVVRRLELAQENFARFAYWSNKENRSGTPLWFNSGDVIFGPTWSNDTIRIALKGALPFAAQFRDVVGTARMIIQPGEADWWKGYSENMAPIALPAVGSLSNLASYATSGRMNFTAPSNGDESTVRMRIEFVNVDIDNDGLDTDPQDGFIRVYKLKGGGSIPSLRADSSSMKANCGEWITLPGVGDKFFTVNSHESGAVRTYLLGKFAQAPISRVGAAGQALADSMNFKGVVLGGSEVEKVLTRSGTYVSASNRSQCYLGGAPELNTNPVAGVYGGDNLTFRANDPEGDWQAYTGTVDPRVLAKRPTDAAYLIPLHRSLNSGARGVIHVDGTVGVSGTVVGRVTLRTTGTTVVLDDVKYGTNPATTGRCVDVLGLLSEKDIVIADNMLQDQTDVRPGAGTNYRTMDDSKDVTLHAVVMALDKSFRVEKHDQGLFTGNPCIGTERGRGCLYLLGGIIQEARGAVTTFNATGGTGFLKQYSYDRCANLRPPPYFPTTGRYLDNRYMEVDPVTFDIATMMTRLTPTP
jgi:hypothetical protein